MIVYNFGQIESIIPAPFRDYVTDCWYLHSMVSICVKRNRICIFLLTQILVKEISRILQEKLWLLGKRLLFLWFHDGNRNTFVKKGKKNLIFYFSDNVLLIMYFSARTLINLTESIRQTLDESSLGRGIFVNVLDLHTYIFKRYLILVITKS